MDLGRCITKLIAVGSRCVHWIQMGQDMFQWQHLVIPVMSLRVPLKLVSFLPKWKTVNFSKHFLLHYSALSNTFNELEPYLESNSCSASLKILSIQWNPKIKPFLEYPTAGSYPNKSNPYIPILFKIHFNFISPSISRSSRLPLSFSFFFQKFVGIYLRLYAC
jgi:hypothetical protein